MGRCEDRRKSQTNPQGETLEKNQDQGVDAHEQREETKEKGEDLLKGESRQNFTKERRFLG